MTDQQRLNASKTRTTSVLWPEAVDDRLELLHHLASEAGEQASRAQILAALVANAPLDGEGIGVMVRSYRRRHLGEFVAETGPMPERRRRPGKKTVRVQERIEPMP